MMDNGTLQPVLLCAFFFATAFTLLVVRPTNVVKSFLHPSFFHNQLSHHMSVLFRPHFACRSCFFQIPTFQPDKLLLTKAHHQCWCVCDCERGMPKQFNTTSELTAKNEILPGFTMKERTWASEHLLLLSWQSEHKERGESRDSQRS